jgi:hypothetical protein
MVKEKGQKDKQQSTKHYTKNLRLSSKFCACPNQDLDFQRQNIYNNQTTKTGTDSLPLELSTHCHKNK